MKFIKSFRNPYWYAVEMSNEPPNPFEPVPEDVPEDWRDDGEEDED